MLLSLLLAGAVVVTGGSHSYQYFYTGVSDPDSGLPDFMAVSYVDNQEIFCYNSKMHREDRCANWVQEAVDPDFWESEIRSLRGWQRGFRKNLVTLQHRYNQTSGSHTLQLMYGCELGEDDSTRGYMQFGYDGGDFISYDLSMRTWVAVVPQAQITQYTLNEDNAALQLTRAYLKETCIKWLKMYLEHGKAALQSKPPMAQVNDRSSRDGLATLSCRVHGFYPKDVAVVWLKNGEPQTQETSRSGVVPSGDGTYQTWATIEIDPSSNHDYTCHVEHVSLGADLRVAWEKKPESSLMLIVGFVIAVMLVLVVAGAAVYFCRRQGAGYKAASTRDGSNSSGSNHGSDPCVKA
ncbi:major histocompatibility complex class I-related gene protein isoform X2 [Alligator mississippiensis]|uniref:major histocompatibility complex class I-related gene protein isoform X2 n=1 Tax=Alligator mississippiensis TaxID=8496 RepID=UPI0028774ADE|nr:major histocompatibility complex class I-related gene protein isoform X2 [Alligator mississippiensis]